MLFHEYEVAAYGRLGTLEVHCYTTLLWRALASLGCRGAD